MSLLKKTIKLAYNNKELRPHLLPLLQNSFTKNAADDLKKEWRQFIKNQRFNHPKTKNRVRFYSLPEEEKKKIREKWIAAKKRSKQAETKPNKPKVLDRYVEEIKEKNPSYDDEKAWATAWSRYCKYKNPSSDHCKKPTSEYFPGKKKK